ncbi:MAG: glutathione peroxidase [Planctomycetota bacterium]
MLVATLTLGGAVATAVFDARAEPAEAPTEKDPAVAKPNTDDPAYVLDHTARLIDGSDVELSEYLGSAVLVVNVASRCGFTPQYEGLQELYASHKEDGLVVLGFPANDFGRQEPGTNSEIAQFCEARFGVEFPMFEKVSVKGDNAHPFYADLAGQPEPIGGAPRWNFTKFLIGRDGKVIARFEPNVSPSDEDFVARIEAALSDG